MNVTSPALEISTDRSRIDVDLVHHWLSQTYWASTRGRGYGKSIVAAMLDYAEDCGVPSVILNTRDARGFYEKFGFVPDVNVETRMIRRLPEHRRRPQVE